MKTYQVQPPRNPSERRQLAEQIGEALRGNTPLIEDVLATPCGDDLADAFESKIIGDLKQQVMGLQNKLCCLRRTVKDAINDDGEVSSVNVY